jgi:hypothetical protein
MSSTLYTKRESLSALSNRAGGPKYPSISLSAPEIPSVGHGVLFHN